VIGLGHELKVRAANSGLVGVMEDEAPVAKKCADALESRGILVRECSIERIKTLWDLAMLATEVTDLAGLAIIRVARWFLASGGRIQMGERRCAIAVVGNGGDVEMVG